MMGGGAAASGPPHVATSGDRAAMDGFRCRRRAQASVVSGGVEVAGFLGRRRDGGGELPPLAAGNVTAILPDETLPEVFIRTSHRKWIICCPEMGRGCRNLMLQGAPGAQPITSL